MFSSDGEGSSGSAGESGEMEIHRISLWGRILGVRWKLRSRRKNLRATCELMSQLRVLLIEDCI